MEAIVMGVKVNVTDCPQAQKFKADTIAAINLLNVIAECISVAEFEPWCALPALHDIKARIEAANIDTTKTYGDTDNG